MEGQDDDLHWTEEETRQGQMQELYLFDGWGSFSGIWSVWTSKPTEFNELHIGSVGKCAYGETQLIPNTWVGLQRKNTSLLQI